MYTFNSIGSNYNLKYLLKSLSYSSKDYPDKLEKYLLHRYESKSVELFYKGRQAITQGLKALDLPKDSKVAVNGFTCFAVYDAVVSAGLTPVYLDISHSNLNFTPETLKDALKKHSQIKVVIIQNTLGMKCEIDKIKKITDENNLILFEDLAHSIGLKYDEDTESGTVGAMAALSFSQDKVVDGVSGGALLINGNHKLNPKKSKLPLKTRFVDKIYPVSSMLVRETYRYIIGKLVHKLLTRFHLISRPMDGSAEILQSMSPWNAKLTLFSFSNLESQIKHRQKIASLYRKYLPSDIMIDHDEANTYIRFPILIKKDRQGLINVLRKNKIYVSDIWYDCPISPARCMPDTNYSGECPNSESISSQIVNLPTHINVSVDDAKYIIRIVNTWLDTK